ncbi:MAG: tRNA (uridine(34)/cytosine(34)/5-carboxymethylaminomethyluridine(34)-2'-O)-methyltransferase TrmL [Phycisphaerae bacterium]|nr:tRNA (uridine(34)/cytosine(34)/5-carboxymethylaminomethyluridine(34)-2'-O)-methyltransferase TrmL [Phycisphaerae bacterium]
MPSAPLNIVLVQPEIPNNTGNIGRTAAATAARLHVVHPIGFDMSEKARRRAGLDYWDLVDCREHENWDSFLELERPPRAWLFTTKATHSLWEARFEPNDYLIFGGETRGAPEPVHDWVTRQWGDEHRISLPMAPGIRSLNLATAVCAGIYEARRQLNPSVRERESLTE